jgi:hypothetical protein
MPRGDVTPRTFEDSAGDVWQVFEVHRTSGHSLGVSPGLEQGWLAFVGPDIKRRLAPFPAEWETLPSADLERLCATARNVSSAAATMLEDRRRGPRIVRARTTLESALDTEQPDAEERRTSPASSSSPRADATSPGDVEAAVRRFARDAHSSGLQAVAAMMALKTMLAEQYPEAPVARDTHRVRRWFVEAYYFERNR